MNQPSRAKREAKEVLLNLKARAKLDVKGSSYNLPPRAKREAKNVLINLSSGAEREE